MGNPHGMTLEFFLGTSPDDPDRKWSEWHLQAYCVMRLRQAGFIAHGDTNGANKGKIGGQRAKVSGAQAGWPDLTVIGKLGAKHRVFSVMPGPQNAVQWFELKLWTGTLRPAQKLLHEAFKGFGQEVHIIKAKTPHAAWCQIADILGLVS